MRSQDSDPAHPRVLRVLVIDDDPALLTTLARVLASEGFQVDVASDGAAGLARARERRPSAVILDLHMPVMDGYAFLRDFRTIPECPAVPVILMSGSPDLATARQRIGAPDVVQLMPKPLDLELLLATLQRMLRGPGHRSD